MSKGEKCRKHPIRQSNCEFHYSLSSSGEPQIFFSYLNVCILISLQRRFSENPSNRIWESEETKNSPPREKIEMVECHNEPSTSSHKVANSTKITSKKLLAALPTLSISGPSPAPSRQQSPTTPADEEENQNFLQLDEQLKLFVNIRSELSELLV